MGGLSSLSFASSHSRQPSPPILPQAVTDDDYLLTIIERDLQEQQQLHQNNNPNVNNESDEEAELSFRFEDFDDDPTDEDDEWSGGSGPVGDRQANAGLGDSYHGNSSQLSKKREWLTRMNRKLTEVAVGDLDPATVPVSAVMNAWAKTKSAQGAAMVELWLKRAQEECEAGNRRVVPTTKMYTMAGKFHSTSSLLK